MTAQAPKYATQVANIKRSDSTLYTEGNFVYPTWEDYLKGVPVLDVANKFRIDFFIFRTENKKSVKFGLSLKECKYLLLKTEAIISGSIVKKNNATDESNASENMSPAYTCRLRGGNMGGKTPVEVIAEDPNKINDLVKQGNWLAQNLDSKYGEANRQQIAAINDAINLFNAGKLQGIQANSSIITLYEATKTPNIKMVDNAGNTQARTFKVTYDANNKAKPFKVEIMNCMAPPVQGAKVGAYLGKATDVSNYNMTLTELEWYGFLEDSIETAKNIKSLMTTNAYTIYEQFRWKRQ